MRTRSHWAALLGTGAAVAVGVVLGCAPLGTAPPSDAAASSCPPIGLQGDQLGHVVAAGDCFGGGNARWYPVVQPFSVGQVCLTCVQPISDPYNNYVRYTCLVEGNIGPDDSGANAVLAGSDEVPQGQTRCYDTGFQFPGRIKWIETLGLVRVQSVAASGGSGNNVLGLQL